MGHRDLQTTLIYAHYAASPHETAMLERALNPHPFGETKETGKDTAHDGR